MTVKDRLYQVVAELTEDEAVQALALFEGARAGATAVDMYGTAWGQVLSGTDPALLEPSGQPTITIPNGIPDVQ